MTSLIILHTNDIHGRVEGLARVATRVAEIRAENPGVPVLYFDCGDPEESTVGLSNVTKGAAMHRLLSIAGCDASAVGNGGIVRYGQQVLEAYAAAASYPLLLANLRAPDGSILPGTQPGTILCLRDGRRLGLIGVSAALRFYPHFFGIKMLPIAGVIRETAASLKAAGADEVLLLSHLGLRDDHATVAELPGLLPLVIGGHSHTLVSEGEQEGTTLIVQAGLFAEHLGRVDLEWGPDGRLAVERACLLPISGDIAPSALVLEEVGRIEAENSAYLAEVIGELAEPLDFAGDRECGAADLMADMLRERMGAEVGVVAARCAFDAGPLPAGPLTRGALWEVCSSSANPGVAVLTGAQLSALVARGMDLAFATEPVQALRGRSRGLLHLSGAQMRAGELLVNGEPVQPEREYRVAASDWEFEEVGGYADPDWKLRPKYEVPTILREALEEYLALHRPVRVEMGRLG